MPLQCIVFSGLICSQHAIEMDLVSPKAPKNPDSNNSSPISISLKTKKLFKFFLLPTQPEQTIVTLLSRYDPILQQLLQKPKHTIRYLSPDIQNELLSILARHLHDHLVNEIKKAPFFAIIGDTTTDISKVDQYSNVIRYVYFDPDNKIVEVRETFLGFHAVHDQSAEGITDMIYGILNRSGLDIQKCRGQGYDGAYVMSGVYSGV